MTKHHHQQHVGADADDDDVDDGSSAFFPRKFHLFVCGYSTSGMSTEISGFVRSGEVPTMPPLRASGSQPSYDAPI